MKKLLCFWLSLFLLLGCLTACETAKAPPGGTSETTSGETERATDEYAEPEDPSEPEENRVLLSELSAYSVVVSALADSETRSAANRLCEALNALELGHTFSVKSDLYKESYPSTHPTEREILVGDTNREESESFGRKLRSEDYGFYLIGKKIAIGGHSGETTEKAVAVFIGNLLRETALSDGVLMTSAESTKFSGEYALRSATVNGHSLRSCVLVYPMGQVLEQCLAESMSRYFFDALGFWVPVQSDEEARDHDYYEILIGEPDRPECISKELQTGDAYIATERFAAVVGGRDTPGLSHAVNLFQGFFFGEESSVAVELAEPIVENAEKETLRFMSFNLQQWGKTAERTENLCNLVTKYMPDLIGVQEATPAWLASLSEVLPGYAYVGIGREDNGMGEFSAIFYNTEKFTVLETETKWLSDTPDVPGSKYPTSDYIRIVTWAVLQRKSDGKIFVHANTHLDWGCRREQLDVIFRYLEEFEGKYSVLLTGDFNTGTSHAQYQRILNEGYDNCAVEAEVFSSGNGLSLSGHLGSAIDFCFINATYYHVFEFRVCNEVGSEVSDHHAIFADILLSTP